MQVAGSTPAAGMGALGSHYSDCTTMAAAGTEIFVGNYFSRASTTNKNLLQENTRVTELFYHKLLTPDSFNSFNPLPKTDFTRSYSIISDTNPSV